MHSLFLTVPVLINSPPLPPHFYFFPSDYLQILLCWPIWFWQEKGNQVLQNPDIVLMTCAAQQLDIQ